VTAITAGPLAIVVHNPDGIDRASPIVPAFPGSIFANTQFHLTAMVVVTISASYMSIRNTKLDRPRAREKARFGCRLHGPDQAVRRDLAERHGPGMEDPGTDDKVSGVEVKHEQ
jgi:hypothetical protein